METSYPCGTCESLALKNFRIKHVHRHSLGTWWHLAPTPALALDTIGIRAVRLQCQRANSPHDLYNGYHWVMG
jgi:hypothetical protein